MNITRETGITNRNKATPETRCVIDIKADSGSLILSKLIKTGFIDIC